jgi:hypothetical protein
MVGLAGSVRKLGWDTGYTSILSLGTNGHAWVDPDPNSLGKLRWLRPLLNTFLAGGEELATFQARSIIGQRLLRIEPALRHEFEMDDVESAFGEYEQIWRKLWDDGMSDVLPWLYARKGDR